MITPESEFGIEVVAKYSREVWANWYIEIRYESKMRHGSVYTPVIPWGRFPRAECLRSGRELRKQDEERGKQARMAEERCRNGQPLATDQCASAVQR